MGETVNDWLVSRHSSTYNHSFRLQTHLRSSLRPTREFLPDVYVSLRYLDEQGNEKTGMSPDHTPHLSVEITFTRPIGMEVAQFLYRSEEMIDNAMTLFAEQHPELVYAQAKKTPFPTAFESEQMTHGNTVKLAIWSNIVNTVAYKALIPLRFSEKMPSRY